MTDTYLPQALDIWTYSYPPAGAGFSGAPMFAANSPGQSFAGPFVPIETAEVAAWGNLGKLDANSALLYIDLSHDGFHVADTSAAVGVPAGGAGSAVASIASEGYKYARVRVDYPGDGPIGSLSATLRSQPAIEGNLGPGVSGAITEIVSNDDSVTVTDGTGPIVDLSVAGSSGGGVGDLIYMSTTLT